MNIAIETITPNKAKKMLEMNTCNRTVRETRVREYANEMTAGRWRLTGQGIVIFEDGRVADGQHRLLAVIESGVTIQTPVARGAKEEAMSAIDIGAKRTVADYMHLHHDVKNATKVCAAVNVIYYISFGFSWFTVQPHLVKIGIDLFGDEIHQIIHCISNFKPGKKSWIYGALAFAAKTDERVFDFTKQLATGENLKKGDPALTMRNWLINGDALYSLNNRKREAHECVMNCVAAYVKGNSYSIMRTGINGLSFFTARNRKFVDLVSHDVRRLKTSK